ncbi:MAG: glycoside hydrolase family 57 protein [Arenicellales bacterium]
MSDGATAPLRVVLCWHMHQPDYRHAETHEYRAPWTYLHAIKDYTDMAWHLETNPDARVVVNFSPVLLEQLEDYGNRIAETLATGADPGDPLLAALASRGIGTDTRLRRRLLSACARTNARVIERFAPYRELVETAELALGHPHMVSYLSEQYFADLLVWYHLAWCGETLRRGDRCVARLVDTQRGYTPDDRRELLAWIGHTISQLIPRYRALMERGQVELSTSPCTHPILPLLLDLESAREARPELPLPVHGRYPGGAARVRWQLGEARRRFAEAFGVQPGGCWPSEGAVSTPVLEMVEESGFRWAASSLGVLVNSADLPHDSEHFHRPYRTPGGSVCFFRDDGLSDRIGFLYKDWAPAEAVRDFVDHLESLAARPASPGRVLAVILDGENPWDSYAENGYGFLRGLYAALTASPRLRLSTFSDCLDDPEVEVRKLDKVCAGSWVYGALDTWIGTQAKNAGWDRLSELKLAFEAWMQGYPPDEEVRRGTQLLAVCEASDWFWWLGSGNPPEVVMEFDAGLREQIAALYRHMGAAVPASLSEPLGEAGPSDRTGVMLPGYL